MSAIEASAVRRMLWGDETAIAAGSTEDLRCAILHASIEESCKGIFHAGAAKAYERLFECGDDEAIRRALVKRGRRQARDRAKMPPRLREHLLRGVPAEIRAIADRLDATATA